MKVMVTGAGGMVGSHMVELLYSQGHDVLGTYLSLIHIWLRDVYQQAHRVPPEQPESQIPCGLQGEWFRMYG